MQKSKLARKGRKGFTLVEVALAVAVGLIIIGGAVLGYNAVKDNASNSNARNKVLAAVSVAEEFSSSNNGMYPSRVQFPTIWGVKRTDDALISPWGGQVGFNAQATNGVTVTGADIVGAYADETAARAGADSHGLTADPAAAGSIIYSPVTTTAAGPWAAVTNNSTTTVVGVRGFVTGIYSKDGATVFWDVKGGK